MPDVVLQPQCEAPPDSAARLPVSVVIPTCRRDAALRRCLCALAGQAFPRADFEVVVVDDGRSETTRRLVAGFAARHAGLRCRYLAGDGRGPARARNRGVAAARGEVIAFVDDDAYPAGPDWLREGLAPFEAAAVAGVCGTVRVPTDEPPTDYQRNVKGLEGTGKFLTCNAFVRRDALLAVGGFDERFEAPYREDTDLEYRLAAAGHGLVCNPRLTAIHPAPPGPFGVSLRLQRYSMYNALLYKKHPARYRELQRWPPIHYYAIVASGLAALIAALRGHRPAALGWGTLWAALEARFFLRRARGTAPHPRHVLDLALTSLLIPPVCLYWRLRGAVRYRVRFL